MAGKIIVSTLQSDTDNSISFVANTGATIFSANISHGIAGSFIANGSITGAKIALGSITGDDIATGQITGNLIATGQITGNLIATGQITGNLIATNAISQNNIVSVNASVATVGTLPTARLPLGTVLQVVQIQKTNTFSTSSTSFVDITDLSASITPISASNKILVCVSINISSSQHSDIRLVRGSTVIAVGDASSNQIRSTFHLYSGLSSSGMGYHTFSSSMMWLDSPATTSSVTYKAQAANPYSGGYVTVINRTFQDDDYGYNGRTPSTITLMEIAA